MGVGSAGKTEVRAAATRGGSALALAWRAGRLQILGYGVLELDTFKGQGFGGDRPVAAK